MDRTGVEPMEMGDGGWEMVRPDVPIARARVDGPVAEEVAEWAVFDALRVPDRDVLLMHGRGPRASVPAAPRLRHREGGLFVEVFTREWLTRVTGRLRDEREVAAAAGELVLRKVAAAELLRAAAGLAAALERDVGGRSR